MKKKLVLLTKYFPPEMGAPQSRLYETVQGLQKRGWEVMVITAMPNYPKGKVFEGYRGKWYRKERVNDIDIYRYTLYASHSKRSFPRIVSMLSFGITSMWSLLKIKKFKPAYIITESPPLTLGLTGLTLAKISGARHIMNVSDIWPLSALRLGAISEGYMYKQLEKLEHYLYSRSYACMGQSAEIKQRLDEHGSRCSLLFRNGVDFNRFEAVRNKVSKPVWNGQLRIVYAGLLGMAQGVAEICRKIDFTALGAELHIYGEGSERKEIEEFVKEYKYKGIYIYPPVHRDAIPETLMQYDITLIPLVTTIYGAVPSKIYEAMAAGIPIIFSGGGEGEQLVKEHNAGWTCQPGDHTCIAETIKKVAAMDSGVLETVSKNCIKAAKNVFHREIQVEHLNQFLLSSR